MKKYIGLLITGLLPLLGSAQLVMSNNYDVVLTGGVLANPTSVVLTNGLPAGITYSGTGGIISENEFNQVVWPVGTNTGTYLVPFGSASNTDYIPVTMKVTTPGVGAGVVKFATYKTIPANTPMPTGVSNLTDFGDPNYCGAMVDRFWEVDANAGYGTKPVVNITFTYVKRAGVSEIAAPNRIVEANLKAQRYNNGLNQWDDFATAVGTDVSGANTGTVNSGSVPDFDFYRSWTLVNDSVPPLGVQQIESSGGISVWPNPAGQTLNVKFGQQGDAIISIANVLGQELVQKGQYVSKGMILPMDISSLSAGMYFLRVTANNSTTTSKFIKK